MKFDIPKIVLSLDLALYHEGFAGKFLHVWVNPPRAIKQARVRLIRESAGIKESTGLSSEELARMQTKTENLLERMFAWFAEIWSQGDDPETHWTVAEIQTVYGADPAFHRWLVANTVRMMDDFRADAKKA